MYARSYYYEKENLVFLTKEDARNYFFEEQLFTEVGDEYVFHCFLSERYSISDIFGMEDSEKPDVLADYHDYLFDMWVNENLIACDMYEG